ncbi:MAG: hypothetical protein AB8B91_05630 [Rubripirellula sp.]
MKAKLPYISDLIEQKITGVEKESLPEPDMQFHESEFHRLSATLSIAPEASHLPEVATAKSTLHDSRVRLRK